MHKDNIIGIVGGMGPQAGIALLNSIVSHTVAKTDQQHLSAILMNFPRYIMDRTAFLDGLIYENPAFGIVEIICKLEIVGANVIGIACNTSYCPSIYNVILEELDKKNSKSRLLNMPYETFLYIERNFSKTNRIGLMTTNGTYRSGIYRKLLESSGYEVIIPATDFQNDVIHRIIYDVKIGIKANGGRLIPEAEALLVKCMAFFRRMKADTIILGCTDFSAVFKEEMGGEIQVVDSTTIFARALIRDAMQFEQNYI